MSNREIAELIADRLPKGLPHPGNPPEVPPAVIRLPGFNTAGMSPAQAEEFVGDFAMLIAEAVVNLIETDGGSEIVPRTTPPPVPKPALA